MTDTSIHTSQKYVRDAAPPLHKRGFFEPRQLENTRKDWRTKGFHGALGVFQAFVAIILLGFIFNMLVQGGLLYALLHLAPQQ